MRQSHWLWSSVLQQTSGHLRPPDTWQLKQHAKCLDFEAQLCTQRFFTGVAAGQRWEGATRSRSWCPPSYRVLSWLQLLDVNAEFAIVRSFPQPYLQKSRDNAKFFSTDKVDSQCLYPVHLMDMKKKLYNSIINTSEKTIVVKLANWRKTPPLYCTSAVPTAVMTALHFPMSLDSM